MTQFSINFEIIFFLSLGKLLHKCRPCIQHRLIWLLMKSTKQIFTHMREVVHFFLLFFLCLKWRKWTRKIDRAPTEENFQWKLWEMKMGNLFLFECVSAFRMGAFDAQPQIDNGNVFSWYFFLLQKKHKTIYEKLFSSVSQIFCTWWFTGRITEFEIVFLEMVFFLFDLFVREIGMKNVLGFIIFHLTKDRVTVETDGSIILIKRSFWRLPTQLKIK